MFPPEESRLRVRRLLPRSLADAVNITGDRLLSVDDGRVSVSGGFSTDAKKPTGTTQNGTFK